MPIHWLHVKQNPADLFNRNQHPRRWTHPQTLPKREQPLKTKSSEQ